MQLLNYIPLLSVILIYPEGSVYVSALSKFVNVKCTALDKSYADFRYCELKVVQRGVVAMNLHVELYQPPAPNVTINLSLWKKANGYRPFMYNYTLDFCAYMKGRGRHPFVKMVLDLIAHYSNINHTCPYNHDIIVKNWIMKDDFLRHLPLPSGDYMFMLKVAAYNDWKADIKVYLLVNEDAPEVFGINSYKKTPNRSRAHITI